MIIKRYEVLDATVHPCSVYSVGVMTHDGEVRIVKWTNRPDDESKFICHVICSMPEHLTKKALGMFERYLQGWEASSKILLERPVKVLK